MRAIVLIEIVSCWLPGAALLLALWVCIVAPLLGLYDPYYHD